MDNFIVTKNNHPVKRLNLKFKSPFVFDSYSLLYDKVSDRYIALGVHESRLRRMKSSMSAWVDSLRYIKFPFDIIGVTLTYAPCQEYESRDISVFFKRVRYYLGNKLFGYFWVCEMQQRGAVHYHVVMVVRKGTRIPFPDSAGWWTKGLTQVMGLRYSKTYRYLLGYAGKWRQKIGFPKGLRVHASSIRAFLIHAYWLYRYRRLPVWLRAAIGEVLEEEIKRGGGREVFPRRVQEGWIWRGAVFISPWQYVGFLGLVKKG